jgi:hypothetical protein
MGNRYACDYVSYMSFINKHMTAILFVACALVAVELVVFLAAFA